MVAHEAKNRQKSKTTPCLAPPSGHFLNFPRQIRSYTFTHQGCGYLCANFEQNRSSCLRDRVYGGRSPIGCFLIRSCQGAPPPGSRIKRGKDTPTTQREWQRGFMFFAASGRSARARAPTDFRMWSNFCSYLMVFRPPDRKLDEKFFTEEICCFIIIQINFPTQTFKNHHL